MWLGLLFHFFLPVYSLNDYSHKIGHMRWAPVRINKCKTPLISEGLCLPFSDCDILLSLQKKEYDPFTLFKSRCFDYFGHLHICCPLFDEPVTLKPDTEYNPVKRYTTYKPQRTTSHRKIEPGTERPFEFSTRSTIKVTEEELGYTKKPHPSGNGDDNVAHHPNMNLIPAELCGLASGNDKIRGGSQANIDEFPWMAMLMYRRLVGRGIINGCGGSLISAQYVLTAAHCTHPLILEKENLKLYQVRLGKWNTSSPKDCQGRDFCNEDGPQDMDIEELITHPNYRPRPGKPFDIALIRLHRKAKFTIFVKPICLPFGDLGVYNERFVTAGWGRTSNNLAKGSDVLQKVGLPPVDHVWCSKLYKNDPEYRVDLLESQICAGGEDGKDSCIGDSGGPLMASKVINRMSRKQIIGIVSFGPTKCGTKNRPGVYTKVSSFLDWILDNIKS